MGEYLLSVVSAAILCAIVKNISGEKSVGGKIIQVITGLFLVITMISPVTNFRLKNIEEYFDDFRFEAEDYTSQGTQIAKEEYSSIIKHQTEAYILDEAVRVGAQMNVEVKLSDSYPPMPYQVVIKGSVSPYQKQYISHYISNNMGITQEHQIWE